MTFPRRKRKLNWDRWKISHTSARALTLNGSQVNKTSAWLWKPSDKTPCSQISCMSNSNKIFFRLWSSPNKVVQRIAIQIMRSITTVRPMRSRRRRTNGCTLFVRTVSTCPRSKIRPPISPMALRAPQSRLRLASAKRRLLAFPYNFQTEPRRSIQK
jgi:hypothetical protein